MSGEGRFSKEATREKAANVVFFFGEEASECCFAMFRLYSWVLGWGDEG